jgi:hypothetical protein
VVIYELLVQLWLQADKQLPQAEPLLDLNFQAH